MNSTEQTGGFNAFMQQNEPISIIPVLTNQMEDILSLDQSKQDLMLAYLDKIIKQHESIMKFQESFI